MSRLSDRRGGLVGSTTTTYMCLVHERELAGVWFAQFEKMAQMRTLPPTALSLLLGFGVGGLACSTTINGQALEEESADASPEVARPDASPQPEPEPDAAPQAAPCVEGDVQASAADETCYMFFATPLDSTAAQAACLTLGATLAIVLDSDQQLIVGQLATNALATNPDVWLGANDTALEATFVWVDGSPVVFDNWRVGEPNNNGANGPENCTIIEGDNPALEWDDRECASLYSYICQRAPAS